MSADVSNFIISNFNYLLFGIWLTNKNASTAESLIRWL